MIRETGRIIAIEEQGEKSTAHIECISKSACSSCQNKSDCGVGVVSKAFSDKTHQFEVPFQQGMKKDSYVELQINNNDLVTSAVVVYLVPLFFFLVGALIAKQLSDYNEGVIISISILSAAVGFAVSRLLSNKILHQKHFDKIISCKIKT
ncbi:SoxR reducing system RseC family protein [Psychromonas ossibalaenae]|uniref:SoxR reducing system RseC family protein n=1 Tax=Psychromonas ossibalaenae TaxID=444922 RepID=UPI00037AF676|nr:SoxR reducing system RseC family protein [Psychromonas ossibalaenae]